MKRRDFIGVCAATSALGPHAILAADDLRPRFYSRVPLVDPSKQPLHARQLAHDRNYIFHYPYESTPCFLLNLGRPARAPVTLKVESGGSYEWPGGVGPDHSIVGYSAICAHRLAYPTRQITFISYRDKTNPAARGHTSVIHCCSEHSEYDPAQGARVVDGPAPQPLSAILLEYDAATDGLFAVGTLGGEMFDAFFKKYEFKLSYEYGSERARQRVSSGCVVSELTQYCRQQVQC